MLKNQNVKKIKKTKVQFSDFSQTLFIVQYLLKLSFIQRKQWCLLPI